MRRTEREKDRRIRVGKRRKEEDRRIREDG